MTALYGLIIEKILQKEPIDNGEKGYYFALAHNLQWREVLDRLAAALHARGLVADPKAQVWPSDEVAAESLGVPVGFLQVLWNSGSVFLPDAMSEELYLIKLLDQPLLPRTRIDLGGNPRGTRTASCRI